MNNAEFFEALKLLEKEKGITGDYLLEKIRAAIIIAVKRDFGGKENIAVIMDPATNEFSVSLFKRIVEEVEDPDEEMLPEEAAKYTKKPLVGETVEIKLETKQFGRIAAQTAKHVIRQGHPRGRPRPSRCGVPAPQSGAGHRPGHPGGSQDRRRHPGNRQGRNRPA